MPSGPAIIECRDVIKWFGSFAALRGITVDIYEGQVVALIGPSGSGKSTFLRCLNRLEAHSRGRIVVDGLELSDDRYVVNAVRDRVGMVFQTFNLFPNLTIEANVTLAQRIVRRRPRRQARQVAEERLTEVGMFEHRKKYPAQLSGGEQQRVAIARALALEPRIMLFDEPTSSIDPELTRGVLEVIERVSESGVTMLIVTHEMGFARRAADRVLFFDEGLLVEDGSAAEVLDHPGRARTKQFLDQIEIFWPRRDERRAGLRDRPFDAD